MCNALISMNETCCGSPALAAPIATTCWCMEIEVDKQMRWPFIVRGSLLMHWVIAWIVWIGMIASHCFDANVRPLNWLITILCGRPAVNHMMLRYLTSMNWMHSSRWINCKDSMSRYWPTPYWNESKWKIGNGRFDVGWQVSPRRNRSLKKERGLRCFN